MKNLLLVISIIGLCMCNVLGKYDPLKKAGKIKTELVTIFYHDGERRSVPLKLYLPNKKNAPTILLSHGLGGSREIGAYLGNHWASRGFLVVAMQHPGSDESVWEGLPKEEAYKKLKDAANKDTFKQRNKDVVATLDYLEKSNKNAKHVLYRAIDLNRLGIGGHSYGAITSQATTGQRYPLIGAKYTDQRLKAAFMMSPSGSKLLSNKKAFGSIKLPWMCMTGTKDSSVLNPRVTYESRMQVYQNLPATGNKYQLVLKDAEHMAFSDKDLLGRAERNPNHHRVIIALSTAFFETHLNNSKEAKVWLHSDQGAKSLLEQGDTWEKK